MSGLVHLFHIWVVPSAIVALDYNYENDTERWKVTALLSTGASVILKELKEQKAAKECMAQCVQILLDHEQSSKLKALVEEYEHPKPEAYVLVRERLTTIAPKEAYVALRERPADKNEKN